ncbi:cob(I)yrinic acid a,c-diamide adenosyltransferase [Liquorilactobacillus vini]|uniref:Corrinoid adenosyltransferase n=1 Tax=Liquorilactobacillus vini DSM 20605 TaxID=1133569 RepID=A0A0R2CD45_9LACO|nr:cob(I)yrinic acid a,c-diamide adenosyltransferase [Liquorilactobacillus vini]KRM86297.1 hypothetical protein FD21_GL001676 [Liquorilactobacillus vini DSM 20605]
MKIYTKVGDQGQTKQASGKMVSKTDPQIVALGDLDQLQSWLGLVISWLSPACKELKPLLLKLQRKLYQLQAQISIKNYSTITATDTAELEKKIDQWMAAVPAIHEFILPGGKPTGAGLQYARTLARQAERAVVKLAEIQQLEPAVLTYLNRLSDYLFAMARYANYLDGEPEITSKTK